MPSYTHASTGLPGLDRTIDDLRLGDNVVWQVDAIDDYRRIAQVYVDQARAEGRKLVYLRFARHEPLLGAAPDITEHRVDPAAGFESFAHAVHRILSAEDRAAFYVFDCLSDLLESWHSDLAVMNFFKVTCPYLFELDAVAYFALLRDAHASATIAGIRETTQLLLDLYVISGETYIHPLKVWGRHSPTMFFPHLVRDDEAISITSSAEAAQLFARITRTTARPDHWQILLDRAWSALPADPTTQEQTRIQLLDMLIGSRGRMGELCHRYLRLPDLLGIAAREIGSGSIGGKSVGMLVARAILEHNGTPAIVDRLEPHDSYYLGSDLFYTYIVANGWWRLWVRHKSAEGYFSGGAELAAELAHGRFPHNVSEQFVHLLEHFGQSPIIVRSSSLLEDDFGNAFAGKYESVFCANQGTPEERYRAFESAVRQVYASAMSEEALAYRHSRGLAERDEQMAVLVQRVSGDHHGEMFFPHAAGVGNSSNLYVWDRDIDMDAGMLRLVVGLGTRAVDRSVRDYARIVALDKPTRTQYRDEVEASRYSQRRADVLSLLGNDLRDIGVSALPELDPRTDWSLFFSPDHEGRRRWTELGRRTGAEPWLVDFQRLLSDTDFASVMRDILATLSGAYAYPVDIEFTVNISRAGSRTTAGTTADKTAGTTDGITTGTAATPPVEFTINLVQCRPLQTRGLGAPVELPDVTAPDEAIIAATGEFMGGNVRLLIEYAVLVRPEGYLALDPEGQYSVARHIGRLNAALAGRSFMLLGPGRWGTTSSSLGIPVRFAEIRNAAVLVEFTYPAGDFRPELSYGSHFFQDLVEAGIFYAALFVERDEVTFNLAKLLGYDNQLLRLDPDAAGLADVVHVVALDGVELFSDIVTQRLVCR